MNTKEARLNPLILHCSEGTGFFFQHKVAWHPPVSHSLLASESYWEQGKVNWWLSRDVAAETRRRYQGVLKSRFLGTAPAGDITVSPPFTVIFPRDRFWTKVSAPFLSPSAVPLLLHISRRIALPSSLPCNRMNMLLFNYTEFPSALVSFSKAKFLNVRGCSHATEGSLNKTDVDSCENVIRKFNFAFLQSFLDYPSHLACKIYDDSNKNDNATNQWYDWLNDEK